MRSRLENLIFTLVKVRKNILNNISILILANKKIFSKNCTLSALSVVEKTTITFQNISKIEPSIFCVAMSVFWIARPSFFTKARYMALILLLESIKARI